MKETTRRIIAGSLVLGTVLAVALALYVPRAKASMADPNYYNPVTIINATTTNSGATANGGWTNGINPQTSATAFNGVTNRTRVDLRGASFGRNGQLILQFQGNVTASTVSTNIAIRLATSLDSLTNGYGGVETNAQIFWTWTIATAAQATPQLLTAVTNVNLDSVGSVPYVYVESIWLGYCDGFLTNWTLKADIE